MNHDPRDELWGEAWRLYYQVYFEEICVEQVVRRWSTLDELSRVFVALTASGSAVAGWALWNQPYFRTMWTILAGVGAFSAILHTQFAVPTRLRDLCPLTNYFAVLRVELEGLRGRMAVNPTFPVTEFQGKLDRYRTRYAQGIGRIKQDTMRTKRLERRAQDALNTRLELKKKH